MYKVFICVTVEHEWRLVLLAGAVCFLASFVTVDLFRRARDAEGRSRLAWLVIAGAAGACGIWATHFIAMLAYQAGVPVAYDVGTTALSLVVAMLIVSTGLAISVEGSRLRAAIGGANVGLGVSSMHYLGMAAVKLPGQMTWSYDYVAASIVAGVLFASAALSVAAQGGKWRSNVIAALLLTLAITSMHFTAMAAMTIIPDPSRVVDAFSFSRGGLAIAIAGVNVAILGMSLMGAIVDRRLVGQAEFFGRKIGQMHERAAQDAEAALTRLRDAFEAVPGGLALFDAEDRYVLCNRAYSEIYAESPDQIVAGMRFEDTLRSMLARGLYKEARGREEAWLRDRLAQHAAASAHSCRGPLDAGSSACAHCYEQPLTDGRWIRVAERLTSEGGRIGVHIDITELKHREASFELLLESNPVPMWVYDKDSLRFLRVNDAAVASYGYTREQFLSMSFLDILPPEDRDEFREVVELDSVAYEAGLTRRHLKADGSSIEVATYSRSLRYEGHDAAIVAAIDITERKQAEERIDYLAHHDPLTDLPNRAAFTERLASAFDEASSSSQPFAVACVDLDGFKEINDVFGHSVGDAVLREASRRLATTCEDAFLARVGGDEFTIVVPQGAQPAAVAQLADRLLAAIAQPFEIEQNKLRVGLSIGVAIFPRDGADQTTLLGNADAALYRAKSEGRGRARFFDAEMDAQLRQRHALQQDLYHALERGEFEIHYQPQAAIRGGIIGFEALLRWRHPSRGFVPPASFIPIAEENGQIFTIGEWLLREACREAATWAQPLKISINLSPVQFRQENLPRLVHAVLLETGLAAERLELEITEGVLINDFSRATSILRRLKSLGVRIDMDDFGTGYSSLSYLQSFPFDKIKIDRSFVSSLDQNPQSSAIVRSVIGLGRGLGLPVIAEGVETEDQLAFLRAEGCAEAQGFLIGRPRPIADYAEIVGRPKPREAKTASARYRSRHRSSHHE